jgi:hypothetical protein
VAGSEWNSGELQNTLNLCHCGNGQKFSRGVVDIKRMAKDGIMGKMWSPYIEIAGKCEQSENHVIRSLQVAE